MIMTIARGDVVTLDGNYGRVAHVAENKLFITVEFASGNVLTHASHVEKVDVEHIKDQDESFSLLRWSVDHLVVGLHCHVVGNPEVGGD